MGRDNEPTLLLTNDDGVHEPGLEALYRAAEGLGRRLVVAPEGPRSNCGHSITTGVDIEVDPVGEGWFAVRGTPADCVRVGLAHLASDASWVLSGINAGANLGADIYHSGTVAAAREAVLHGRPGIAFSQYYVRGRPLDWERAAGWAARVLKVLFGRPWVRGTLWNVNLPHPEPGGPEPRIIDCPADPSPLPLTFQVSEGGRHLRYAGDYHSRMRIPAGDVATCFGGDIALSRVWLLPRDPDAALPADTAGSALVERGDGDA